MKNVLRKSGKEGTMNMVRKLICLFLCGLLLTGSVAMGEGRIGVSMPTREVQRWNQDSAYMKELLEAEGYTVDIQFASNDLQMQLSQIENMIASEADVLIIAPVDASSLGEAMTLAGEEEIPIIAYDRLILHSGAVSYYATFDNYKVGQVQGMYIRDALELDEIEGPCNMEITSGDPGDNNAGVFYLGAMDVLMPYIESGKLRVVSGQTDFMKTTTENWSLEEAQGRAENILSSYYSNGTPLHAWLCANDSMAMGVINAIAANYQGPYPVITGQDCDLVNIRCILEGKQSMSVFKDTRMLAEQVVSMVGQILRGEEVDVNDRKSYFNGAITVPAYLCEPRMVNISNYQEKLIHSGYYTEEQLH